MEHKELTRPNCDVDRLSAQDAVYSELKLSGDLFPGRGRSRFRCTSTSPKAMISRHWSRRVGELGCVEQDHGAVDLCYRDPGFDVDLFVEASLRVLTQIWLGHIPIDQAIREGRLRLEGSRGAAKR
jgi:hypothetical protein